MSNYVTRIDVTARPAPYDAEWLWTIRVYTAARGEAFVLSSGSVSHSVGAHFSEKDIIRLAVDGRLDKLIEHALQMGPDA
jgi:hypothetical protein